MPEPATPDFWLDHVGWVAVDIAHPVAQLTQLGFRTSEPTALCGRDGPLGQHSAHCVFENFYLEISAPVAGSGNHLEPLLAHGPGVRIVVLGCEDAELARRHLSYRRIAYSPLKEASRTVRLAAGARDARFRWFALEGLIPDTLVALVEHQDRPIVFAGELADHPNGVHRIAEAVLGRAARPLTELLAGKPRNGPSIVWDETAPDALSALACDTGLALAFAAGRSIAGSVREHPSS